MRHTQLSLPELGLVAGTRAALGFGLALLLADRWSPDERRAIGWSLFLVGLGSTIPLAFEVLGRSSRSSASQPGEGSLCEMGR
ncbi:MAG TPA: hypothetical protein VLM40_03850 [Gemmata sp.]|nr:hypothetical protein [Gemmata sp.]